MKKRKSSSAKTGAKASASPIPATPLDAWKTSKVSLVAAESGQTLVEDEQYGVHWIAHDLPEPGPSRWVSVGLSVRARDRSAVRFWFTPETATPPHFVASIDLADIDTVLQSPEGPDHAVRVRRLVDGWVRVELFIRQPEGAPRDKIMIVLLEAVDGRQGYTGRGMGAVDIADAGVTVDVPPRTGRGRKAARGFTASVRAAGPSSAQ